MTVPPSARPQLRSTLTRWQAGLLDPRVTSAGEYPTASTAYRTAGLTVWAADPGADRKVRAAVDDALRSRGWRADHLPSGVHLRPGDATDHPVDAWALVSELRRNEDPDVAAGVGLDHLMTTAEQLGGNPLAVGHGRVGLDRYGDTGYAGRGPVNFVIPAPNPTTGSVPAGRRPRVVVLDTGIGDHPWFRERPAQLTITLGDGTTVGPQIDPASIQGLDADGRGAVASALLGTLASHSGHGTFIAGLLRQACPAADIVALAVMGADGIVAESTLTDALRTVVRRQQEQPGWADALVLSLGYYAETDADVIYNSALRQMLLQLGRLGIAVFCAAGNDASGRPSYPAAFAIDPAFGAVDVVPLVSVAALNPDGTVAQFSNDGPWVIAEAPGVNLVSTAPTDTDGSARAGVAAAGPLGRPRGGVDPDRFASGFASWSGTSFAAPALAGMYLRALTDADFPPLSARRSLVPIGRAAGVLR